MSRLASCLALALALALASPLAAGGSPDEPEVEDAALDAGAGTAWGDVTRAWMELSEDRQTLQLWMEFHVLPEATPGIGLVYAFAAANATWYGAAATSPTLAYWWGEWTDGGPLSSFDGAGAWESGPGGRVRVDVPVASLPADAAVADAHLVMAWDLRPQLAEMDPLLVDDAEGARPFALRAADAAAVQATGAAWEAAEPAERVPWLSVGFVVAALAVGAVGLRRSAGGGP